MDHVLSYIDQASFMGVRALGRGPIIEWTWVHDRAVSAAAIDAFNRRLAHGSLGRLVQRSSVPGGRHRWVASPVPAPVTVGAETMPIARLPAWRRGLVDLAIDPEHGPGWRLVVQPLAEGGTVLSLLVSHTIADGLAVAQAIRDAAAEVPFDHAYPPRPSRRSWRQVARDLGVSARSLPDAWAAITLLARRRRTLAPGGSSPAARPAPSASREPAQIAEVPAVQVVLDEGECASRAAARGVTVTTLLAAFSARLGFRLGRVGRDGHVKLVLPVSDRTPGDVRANALRSITVRVDPHKCCARPDTLHRDIRSALAALREHGDDSPILALVPYVPLFLVPRLERLHLGADLPVGCSILGDFDAAVNRPCGTEAAWMHVTLIERHTASTLDAIGGKLFLASHRLANTIYVDVSCWAPGVVAARADLVDIVGETLGDLTLTGTVR